MGQYGKRMCSGTWKRVRGRSSGRDIERGWGHPGGAPLWRGSSGARRAPARTWSSWSGSWCAARRSWRPSWPEAGRRRFEGAATMAPPRLLASSFGARAPEVGAALGRAPRPMRLAESAITWRCWPARRCSRDCNKK